MASKILPIILFQCSAMVTSLLVASPIYRIIEVVSGDNMTANKSIGSISTVEPGFFGTVIGFFAAFILFSTLAHFILYARPKIYWWILIAPSLLIGLVDWRFLLIQITYLLIGLIIGSLIRIIAQKLKLLAKD